MTLTKALELLHRPCSAELTAPKRLDEAALRIEQRYGTRRPVSQEEAAVLIADLARRIAVADWQGARERDVAAVLRAIFSGQLPGPEGVVEFLYEELALTRRPLLLAALCESYLLGWRAGSPATVRQAQLITDRAADLSPLWRRVFVNLPEIADAERGHKRLAERMLAVQDAYGWLRRTGLPSPHGAGFMQAVHGAYVDALPAMRDRGRLDILLGWLAPDGKPGFSGEAAAIAIQKMLAPWRNSDPDASLREFLVGRLAAWFKDPRRGASTVWPRVGAEERKVMLRWLAGESMRAFLDVVSEAEERHMWEPRQAFWRQCYEAGRIQEAWVAFDPKAEAVARRKYAETDDPAFASFGRQAGARRDISLLFMRCGDRIVVEGSFSYRVHVFKIDQERCPKLYRSEYKTEDITLPMGHRQAKRHDPGGNWEQWVLRRIR